MKGGAVLLGRHAGREAAALMVDGVLEDLLVEPPAPRPLPGTIYRAIPDRPMKGIGGMFLRLPHGTGFLRQTRGITPGRPLLVQVTGYAEAGKAVPVTTRLAIKGRGVVVTPAAPGRNISRRFPAGEARARLEAMCESLVLPEGAGLILRSQAAQLPQEAVAEEARHLADVAACLSVAVAGPPELLLDGPRPHQAALRDWATAGAVDAGDDAFARHGVDDAIRALLSPEVTLSGGGRMSIEPTRALVAVDVDTGADVSPAAALKADIAAARLLPRELRCRGLGGQITIDFAPIPRRDRQRVEQALGAALRRDPVETVIAGWTPLSHMELRRQRSRLPLAECLS